MYDTTTTHLDGPDFLEAVADAEEHLGNHINAAEYRRRARQWANERAQREREDAAPTPAPAARTCALPAHHITPSDRR